MGDSHANEDVDVHGYSWTRQPFPARPLRSAKPLRVEGTGRALDLSTRALFQPRFRHDFEHVRIHDDGHAAHSARALGAAAYTIGSDIVFGRNRYSPSTTEGQRLLAHELAHVVQQENGLLVTQPGTVRGSDAAEREAESIAARAADRSAGPDSARVRERTPWGSVQRVAFGKDGELSPDLKEIVQAAARIVERRIMASDFEPQWNSFWQQYGKAISPRPSLQAYRTAVISRTIHDMDASTFGPAATLLKEENGLPLEGQTAAATMPGSKDTYMRRFAIRQGVDSVASLLLHESWHGAGLPMGPLEMFEPAFHEFEQSVGYPLMMGGATIESVKQKRRGDTGVDVTIAYSLHKIGPEPLPRSVALEVTAGDLATPVFQKTLPSRAGRHTVAWRAENPGWNSYSIRILNLDQRGTLMAAERIETDPKCVLGVSTMHCESD